jgi:hypothetical protein
MQTIKFKAFGSSAVFGSFAPGDVLRCSDDVARHFVEDAQAADYVGAAQASAQSAAATQQPPAGATRPAAKRARRADGA